MKPIIHQPAIGWLLAVVQMVFVMAVTGQTYTVDWYKISSGGGTSTTGPVAGTNYYSVSGTIGQPDAGGVLNGGNYAVTGGFWALINVVQMPGVPNLVIVPNGAGGVKILWPDPATNTYTLQQNNNLAVTAGWATSGYSVTNSGGTNFITLTAPAGNLFFRLKK
jgi:hypothetical protein